MAMGWIVGFGFVCLPCQNHAKLLNTGTCGLEVHPYTYRGLGFLHQILYSEGPNVWRTEGVAHTYIEIVMYVCMYICTCV